MGAVAGGRPSGKDRLHTRALRDSFPLESPLLVILGGISHSPDLSDTNDPIIAVGHPEPRRGLETNQRGKPMSRNGRYRLCLTWKSARRSNAAFTNQTACGRTPILKASSTHLFSSQRSPTPPPNGSASRTDTRELLVHKQQSLERNVL